MGKIRFTNLDGLRGICAFAVLLEHCEKLFTPGVIVCHGWLAVDMFFLLSGFVIAAGYDERFKAGLTAPRFTWLRLKRLAPVYWVGLALCCAAALAQSHYDPRFPAGGVWTYTAMASVLIPKLGWNTFAYPANPVAWTLAWELIVNILYAAGLWRARGPTLLLLIALLVSGAVLASFSSASGWSFGMTGLGIGLGGLRALPEFLTGALVYRAYRAGLLARLPLVAPSVLFLVWGCLAVLPQGTPPLLDAGIAILIHPLLLALLVRGEGTGHAWFGWLGNISYPLYASHLAPIWVAWYTPWLGLDRGPNPLRACGVVLLALGLAWAIWRLADPAANRRKSVGSHGQKAALAACDPAPNSV